ncbi:MAG: thiamine phosphate synthase [Chitinophaga sp.]|uniref:thiamine phosphate synthase n=1 Tax=Chitinophaga sp. TaxID=1869181 RepID=UPI001B279B67|nr:thiamine phosphate synthase [Chitinophaga sp.]MBO9728898.1 thiamine phosphate synthase [Chitinophaga sp.]
MIWVITSPERIHEEVQIISGLLSAGASRVVLRKPGWTQEQYRALLEGIPPDYYGRLLIRDEPLLATEYGLAGVHWSKAANTFHAAAAYSENSIGIHSADEITVMSKRYSVLLLSPVFDSISKPGYTGRAAGTLTNKDHRPVLALGGVDHTNIISLKKWQFDGAALLGAVWQTPAKAVENYYRIQELWNKSDLT